MLGNQQPIPIKEIYGILLGLNNKLLQIDSIFDPEIEKLAKETAEANDIIGENQKEDFSKKIMIGNLDTFPLLQVDAFSLLREIQDKTVTDLREAIDNAFNGRDITQYTHAQSVELLRVLSLMSGYVSQFTNLAEKNKKDYSITEPVILVLKLLTKRIKKEQQKTYHISLNLLQRATKDVPTLQIYDLTFKPIFGYTTYSDSSQSAYPQYQEFCQNLKETSDRWFNAGGYLGNRRFEQFKPSANSFRWII